MGGPSGEVVLVTSEPHKESYSWHQSHKLRAVAKRNRCPVGGLAANTSLNKGPVQIDSVLTLIYGVRLQDCQCPDWA